MAEIEKLTEQERAPVAPGDGCGGAMSDQHLEALAAEWQARAAELSVELGVTRTSLAKAERALAEAERKLAELEADRNTLLAAERNLCDERRELHGRIAELEGRRSVADIAQLTEAEQRSLEVGTADRDVRWKALHIIDAQAAALERVRKVLESEPRPVGSPEARLDDGAREINAHLSAKIAADAHDHAETLAALRGRVARAERLAANDAVASGDWRIVEALRGE